MLPGWADRQFGSCHYILNPTSWKFRAVRSSLKPSSDKKRVISMAFDDTGLSFRVPMPVTQLRCYREGAGLSSFPVCPRCAASMEREYQSYCDRCGQCLSWRGLRKAQLLFSDK